MGKPTTAVWLNGALLALGNLAATTSAQAEYAVYHESENSYQIQQASYRTQPVNYQIQQASYQSGWNQHLSLPPEIRPYDELQPPPQAFTAQPQHIPSGWPWQQQVGAIPQPRQQQARVPPVQMPRPQAYLTAERKALLDTAYRSLGITYRWGGNTPREGFDCSGLTKFSHKSARVSIPRTAAEQSQASRTISRQELRPGDMIFFQTSGRVVNHVGIYVGNGKFIHAASGGGRVTLDDLRKSYWQKRLVKYGTFLS